MNCIRLQGNHISHTTVTVTITLLSGVVEHLSCGIAYLCSYGFNA